jgi:hypothetical protein
MGIQAAATVDIMVIIKDITVTMAITMDITGIMVITAVITGITAGITADIMAITAMPDTTRGTNGVPPTAGGGSTSANRSGPTRGRRW